MLAKITSLLVCLVAMTACLRAQDENSDGGRDGQRQSAGQPGSEIHPYFFVAAADLDAGELAMELEGWELEKDIDEYLYANEPVEPSDVEPTGLDKCMDSIQPDFPIQANGHSMMADFSMDFSDCVRFMLEDPDLEIVGEPFFEMRMMRYQKCLGVDLSGYNGIFWTEIRKEDGDPCEGAEQIQFAAQMEMTMKVSVDYGGGEPINMHTVSYSANHMVNNSPCEKSLDGDSYEYEDGCLDIEREVNGEESDNDVGLDNLYVRLISDDLTAKAGNPAFFSSGQYDVVYGNWQGTVTYDGEDGPVTWEATDGYYTIEGEVTAPADGLGLVKEGKNRVRAFLRSLR